MNKKAMDAQAAVIGLLTLFILVVSAVYPFFKEAAEWFNEINFILKFFMIIFVLISIYIAIYITNKIK